LRDLIQRAALTNRHNGYRRTVCCCFSELTGKAGLPFHASGDGACDSRATKRGQAIENKQFCEMTSFAPPMIPTNYDRIAKPFVSLSEMNPLAFAGFSASSRSNTQWREIKASGLTQRTLGESATRKWRRKPLESLKTDSEMAPPAPVAGRENRLGELRISP
jgi:hypothetical protein